MFSNSMQRYEKLLGFPRQSTTILSVLIGFEGAGE
jgi:hypothetical protein